MKHIYTIKCVDNGYIINIYGDTAGITDSVLVARSWVEVLEILTEIGAPDFMPETGKPSTYVSGDSLSAG